jgi:AcrR family transcriptional regulator
MRQRLPGEERRRLIIDAATELFSKHGLKGTTTREVAKAVGISEATIFKHFATKEELYTAIIEGKAHAQREHVMGVVGPLAEARDDAAFLRTLATELIARAHADPTFMRLLFFSALEGHALADLFFRQRVLTIDVFLGRYIADRIATGAFRPADPLQTAWNFIGMVTFHVLLHELFGQKPPAHLTRERAVEEMVTTFLEGVRSSNGETARAAHGPPS